jgi:hypothetical protein
MRDVRCDYLVLFFPFSLFLFFLFSLLLASFPLLHERLTYVPSGTAIMRFPGLLSRPLLACLLCSLYFLFFLLHSGNFVDLPSVLSPRAFPYRFPCLFDGDMNVYDSSL